jgi:hypothetical protein
LLYSAAANGAGTLIRSDPERLRTDTISVASAVLMKHTAVLSIQPIAWRWCSQLTAIRVVPLGSAFTLLLLNDTLFGSSLLFDRMVPLQYTFRCSKLMARLAVVK